jgi:alpha-L-fucosidase
MMTPKSKHVAALCACFSTPLHADSGVTVESKELPPAAPGRFEPNDASLKKYEYPEWFRDAKFGIWAHWGLQAVPRHGDWYARKLYMEGDGDYADHLIRYGHPLVKGYMDIIPLWKSEKWDRSQRRGNLRFPTVENPCRECRSVSVSL